MAKKASKKKFVRKIRLDSATSIFFGQLLQEGLATYEEDKKLPKGEAFAEISKDAQGNSNIVIKSVDSLTVCIFAAD